MDNSHLADATHQIEIDFGYAKERVACLRGLGDCQDCESTMVPVRKFSHPAIEPETGPLVLCDTCIADDPELALVSVETTTAAPQATTPATPEAAPPAPAQSPEPEAQPYAKELDQMRRAIASDGRAYAYITWTGPERLGGYENEPGAYTGNYKVYDIEQHEGKWWLGCKELSGSECDIPLAEVTAIVVD
jgi:hypothetical protein